MPGSGSKIYFVGICGIGMSALAQAFRWLGCEVAGSDRNISPDGVNGPLLGFFGRSGIRVFPQDGSFAEHFRPDCVVYSTAVEKGNPDFAAAEGVPMLHRSEALAKFLAGMEGRDTVAVTGTSGKTTVTSWLGESLANCGEDPAVISGGNIRSLARAGMPGNFRPGKGRFVVFEADESDKSLLNCPADYGVILNTGADHYPEAEQLEVFAKFASMLRKGLVCEADLFAKIAAGLPGRLRKCLFHDGKGGPPPPPDTPVYSLDAYSPGRIAGDRIFSRASIGAGKEKYDLRLPLLGRHNAMNAASVVAALRTIGVERAGIPGAIENFSGVERRFQYQGRTSSGALVFDDYAHNPEKISSCLAAAQSLGAGGVLAVFQPHGYGPFGFMKDALLDRLRGVMRPQDKFVLLPVFYAGGTSSFSPKPEDVAEEFRTKGIANCRFCPSRKDAENLIAEEKTDGIVVVMGARDQSLSDWAAALCAGELRAQKSRRTYSAPEDAGF